MNPHEDWERWIDVWQQQPLVDVDRLRRGVIRKQWRMRLAAALELLATLVAVGQTLRAAVHPGLELRWRIWALVTLAFVLVVQWSFLHARRGAWRALGSDVQDLLRLTARRATVGIRLAKLNLWSMSLWIATTLVVAIPELTPERWQHDPKLKLMIVLQFAINVPIVLMIMGVGVWYIRRQRRRLCEVTALLLDYRG